MDDGDKWGRGLVAESCGHPQGTARSQSKAQISNEEMWNQNILNMIVIKKKC